MESQIACTLGRIPNQSFVPYIQFSHYGFLQLNDVASGGRTVFPRIGAGVAPVAGSAVFWYNLFPSGDADQLTLHGACPVLYGTKWGKNT